MPGLDWLLGRPLASDEERQQRLGIATGIPTFGLDALSSAAYGPEAALTLLIPLGAAGAAHLVPLDLIIIALLGVVYFSYRQTIDAYPNGGGSYTVASQNLGAGAGLLAAAALMIDYVLDAAVGISAGVGALVSAMPKLQPHTVGLCLGILALLTLINLRGVREAGVAFTVPTYLFVGCLAAVIAAGVERTWRQAGHPRPVIAPPHAAPALAAASLWLLIRAFAGGCTALTGVEAVSNGVRAFRDPTSQTARRTLGITVGILALLLAGIAYLARAYDIVATPPGRPGYQSVLAMLTAAVAGRGWFYDLTIASILVVLSLSANTAFADFPRLCRMVAEDGYLPSFFAIRGRRLVYSVGIGVLTLVTALLLALFGGVTDRLIPLFAIGAFLAFTLSQAGMVFHWRRKGGRGARHSMAINAVGAVATGLTVLVVLVAKFIDGAWITVLLIPLLVMTMLAVKRQYRRAARQTALSRVHFDHLAPPLAVVPIALWNRATEGALRFAFSMTRDVQVLHIRYEPEQGNPEYRWQRDLAGAARQAGLPEPRLVTIDSPYRFVVDPIVNYVLEQQTANPGRPIAVVVPEIVQPRWYHFLLHNHHATALKALFLLKGNGGIVVIDVPLYLK